jgi:hypothetical protein
MGKGFFWWGERARAPAGVGAELRDFLGNRFGLRRKIAPKQYFYGNCRPLGRFFLWRRAAPASSSEGGERKWGAGGAALFCFLETGSPQAAVFMVKSPEISLPRSENKK